MTPADRMAAALDRQPCQRVGFDALAGAADQGDSSLPTSPGRRQVLADAAGELVRRELVILPVGPEGWDHSAYPPLPRWVRRTGPPVPARVRPGPRAWVEPLDFATRTTLTAGEVALLGPINTLLRDRPHTEPVPLAERAYELFGDEKHLARIGNHRLVTSGLLSITAHLRAHPSPAPLAMFELGPAPWMLVIENSATFTSLRTILSAWPDRDQVGWLAYGAGDHLVASLPTAAQTLRERAHPVTDLLLYGDLDLDGLQCAQQADRRAHTAGLPPVRPAGRLYEALMRRTPRQLRPADPEGIHAAVGWLPAPLAEPVERLLLRGEVLRQEALPLPVLRELLIPHSDLLAQLKGDTQI